MSIETIVPDFEINAKFQFTMLKVNKLKDGALALYHESKNIPFLDTFH